MTLKSIIAAVTISVIAQFCVAMDAIKSQVLPNETYLAIVMECPLKKRIEMRQVSKLTRDTVDKIHEEGTYLEELAFEIAIQKNVYMELDRRVDMYHEWRPAFELPKNIGQFRDWCSKGYEFKRYERHRDGYSGFFNQYYSFWLFHYGIVRNCLPLVRYALDQHNNFINIDRQTYCLKEEITIPLTCGSFKVRIFYCKNIITDRYNRTDALLDVNNNSLRNILLIALENLEKLAENDQTISNDPIEIFMENLSGQLAKISGNENLFNLPSLNGSPLDCYKNGTCKIPTYFSYLVEKNFVDVFNFVIYNEIFWKASFEDVFLLKYSNTIKEINLRLFLQKASKELVRCFSETNGFLRICLEAEKNKGERDLEFLLKFAHHLNYHKEIDIIEQAIEKAKKFDEE